MPGYDLHVHTTASDGIFSPGDVIRLGMKAGLTGIAITDHDTMAGMDEALQVSSLSKFPVIPGVELSTQHENAEIHILGYYLDYQLPWVQDKLQNLQQARVTRISRMVDKLHRLGYQVTADEVFKLAGAGSVGRPHVAHALINRGEVTTVQEAFHRLIGRGCPAYVPREKFSPLEAVQFVQSAGGIPVMAHPGLARSDHLIKSLAAGGLMGLEVFHPDHNIHDEEKYLEIAGRLSLLVTGGSDFHGFKEGREFSLGSKNVPAHTILQMENLRQRRV